MHIMWFNKTNSIPFLSFLLNPPHHFSHWLHVPRDTAFYWLPWMPHYHLIVKRIYISFTYYSFYSLLWSASVITEAICKQSVCFMKHIISAWSSMSPMVLSPITHLLCNCVPCTPKWRWLWAAGETWECVLRDWEIKPPFQVAQQ